MRPKRGMHAAWALLWSALLFYGGIALGQEPPPAYPAPPPGVPPAPAPHGYPAPYTQPPPPYRYQPMPPLLPKRVTRPAAIYGELLGKGLIYSVGFDYALSRHVALGSSFSYLDPAVFISPYVNVYPVGGYRSALLLQAGIQLVHVGVKSNDLLKELLWEEEGFDVGGQVSIGYEFRAGFLFRVALMTMFNRVGVLPWPSLTFGGSF